MLPPGTLLLELLLPELLLKPLLRLALRSNAIARSSDDPTADSSVDPPDCSRRLW